MRRSLVTRFFSTMSLLIVASISLLGMLFIFFANRYLESERIGQLTLCVQSAADAYDDSITSEEGATFEEKRTVLRDNLRLISNTTSTIVLLADENGLVIACTESAPCTHEGSLLSGDVINGILARSRPVQTEEIYPDIYRGSYYSVASTARNDAGNITGYIFAFSDKATVTLFTNALLSMFMISAGVMLLISSAVTVVVTSRMTDPLMTINQATRRFGQGDFSVRLAVEGDEEITQMAATFNRMADFVERNENSRSSFVANVAHELRTPMTSIKGFVDGIRDGTIPPESQDRYLAVISDEVGRLARLTNSMLDISKLESGEFVMNTKEYNIWDTIAAVAFSMENRIEEGNISLKGFRPRKIMVKADEDIIHQVVYNIFDNALKFTPPGGYIALDVQSEGAPGFVTVKIRNSGQGISSDALPYIFERFYKGDYSRSVHTKGAGIGLFIAKTLVQRSGGDITVESREGEYTEFIFTLPAGSGKEPRAPRGGRRGRKKNKEKAEE